MVIPFTAFYMTRNADWKTKWLVSAVRQAEAYEKFLLLGKHTVYPRKDDVDRATWTLGGETLDVSCGKPSLWYNVKKA